MSSDPTIHLFQYISTVNIVPKQDAIRHYKEILMFTKSDHLSNEDELNKQIAILNTLISKLDLEIVNAVDEVTNEKIVVLVNTAANNHISEKAKFYNRSTAHLFSKITQACVMSEKGRVPETSCVNLNHLVEISKTAAQNAVNKLVKDKWLILKDGEISLGMRSILELEQVIKKQYPNFAKDCPLCRTFLIQGHTCSACESKIHIHCLKKYFDRIAAASKHMCPSCKAAWSEKTYEETQMMSSSDDEEEGPSQPKRSRK